MALFAYTASTPRAYPEFGILAEVGDIVDFGLVAIPNDGRWAAAAFGAAPTKTVGPGAPNYTLPGVPNDRDALVWNAALGQYVPRKISSDFTPAPPTGTPAGYVGTVQADGSVLYAAPPGLGTSAVTAVDF